MTERKTCKDCKHFRAEDSRHQDDKYGECRRYAPRGNESGWPTVNEDSWCGDGCWIEACVTVSCKAAPAAGKVVIKNDKPTVLGLADHIEEYQAEIRSAIDHPGNN